MPAILCPSFVAGCYNRQFRQSLVNFACAGSSRSPGDLIRPGRGRGFSDYSGYGETGGTAKITM